MSWTYRLSDQAAKQLRRLPRDRQEQLGRAIDQMTQDPFAGDVRPLKGGRLAGTMRRRVGRYRIIFAVDRSSGVIDVAAIVSRSERTYR